VLDADLLDRLRKVLGEDYHTVGDFTDADKDEEDEG
jgi:hypothetical protein